MAELNKQWLLTSRPTGEASLQNFRLVETPVPPLPDGHVLVRNLYLSLDPYMRMRMDARKSYAPPHPVGEVMLGGTVAEVIESRSPLFAPGDHVATLSGWQTHAVLDPAQPRALRKLDTTKIPPSAHLGAVGMPGVTAWVGLNQIIAPKAGETIVVSAASGAVGSVVGQLAALKGCRVVGIAGGSEKCGYVERELGFAACIDYKQHTSSQAMEAALRDACPNGIDGNFENVGGMILDAVMACANPFARIAVCGMISGYDGAAMSIKDPFLILANRLKIQGFIVSDDLSLWPKAIEELAPLYVGGKLKYRESVAEGIERAPEAFLGMLRGQNFGKQLVKVG
jgi:NADPH-dependent curcumin reductase